MTQAQVADYFNISDSAVCQWESGKTVPETRRLMDIAKLYGCKVDDLLSGNGGD
jgi:transcriptional regulator with XRE-family HTH domain